MKLRKEEKASLWKATRAFWIKYCGIADEYRMLRDRWLYLYEKGSMPILRYLKRSTFGSLDELVNLLSEKFRELGFNRNMIENFNRYSRRFRNIEDLSYFSSVYDEIKNMLFDLTTYVGLLKLAFLQRTVSSEISHVASGVPHSPERTIGNELSYLAADKLAQRYNDCVKFLGSKWDGVITFAPPKESLMFYGAFFRPSYYLSLFHISMSEEQKYFLGTYLALAHEFGHATIHDHARIFRNLFQIAFRYSVGPYLTSVTRFRRNLELEDLLYSVERCRKCTFCPTPLTSEKFELYLDIFEDFMADLIAIHIGGLNTAEELLNEIFRYIIFQIQDRNGRKVPQIIFTERSLIRMSGILSYLDQIGFDSTLRQGLRFRFKKLIKKSQDYLDIVREVEETLDVKETLALSNVCVNCLLEIGELWGRQIGELDKESRELIEKSIFTLFIKEDMFFSIDKKTENRIVKSLLSGTPCPQEYPRHILHAYYEAYKQSSGKKRPNYAATVHSIVFNEHFR